MTYFWLSFVDNDRPEGQRFIGGCLVEAWNSEDALLKIHLMRINPGGEVAIIEITPKYEHNVSKFKINYLYSKAEMQAMGEFRTLWKAREDGDVT